MNLVKREYCASFIKEAYNSSGLITFKEKIYFIKQIQAGVMLSICLIFHQKSGLVCL